MSDHDPIDRLLDEAFRSRPVPLDSHPSMMDVRRRARRRHHRRTGATLGAVALVGVGGAVALAARHDGRDQLAAGEGDLGTPTTITCDGVLPPFDSTTTTMLPNMYAIMDGDTPVFVADKFGVTVEELQLWNGNRPEFESFIVGGLIFIADPALAYSPVPTTTYGWSPYDPCAPGGWTWHCTGPMGTDEFGRDVFESCEQVNDGSFATTTIPLTSSTILEPEVTTSVNGNVDQTTTTSTIAIFEPTTTSLGG